MSKGLNKQPYTSQQQDCILSALNISAPSVRIISRIVALEILAVEQLERRFFALLSTKYYAP